MQNKVVRAAIKFRNKELKKRIDFETVKAVLKSRDYTVLFYDPDKGSELIREHGLEEYAQSVEAFTFKKDGLKFVFIQSKVSCEDKLYMLLHEAGHIVLKHSEKSALISSTRLRELEADTFAYTVLNPPNHSRASALAAWILTMALSFSAGFFGAPRANPTQTDTDPHTSEIALTIEGAADELVYITRTGKKYHLENCVYVRSKECVAVEKEEAQRTHAPCSVCNP